MVAWCKPGVCFLTIHRCFSGWCYFNLETVVGFMRILHGVR